ncbi:MAG: methyltransferase domain-containing protein, partial [Gemmatimonadetes bacterium]|nr:methyltransferase domain-containing protein [Gemmatimonadota bacterium]
RYDEVLADDPDNVEALSERGLLLVSVGSATVRPALAADGRASVERALALRPGSARVLFYRGLALRLEGDVGAGTGLWSEILARHLDATVEAVEPSERMRAVAAQNHTHPAITYREGRAEALPVEAGWADVVWMSRVVGHIADLTAAAAEAARVVRPGGWCVIIATFGDRDSIGGTTYVGFATDAAQQLLGSRDLVSGVVVAAEDGISQEELVARVEMMENVVEGRLYWILFMEAASRTLPAFTWLEAIDRTDLPPDQVRIAGATFSNAAVTEYMRGLEASPVLRDVTLVGVTRTQQDSLQFQSFTLVAGLEGYDTVVLEQDTNAQGGQ